MNGALLTIAVCFRLALVAMASRKAAGGFVLCRKAVRIPHPSVTKCSPSYLALPTATIMRGRGRNLNYRERGCPKPTTSPYADE